MNVVTTFPPPNKNKRKKKDNSICNFVLKADFCKDRKLKHLLLKLVIDI